MRLSRDIAALVVSVALFGVVPIYGAPFGGCVESGFRTFAIGCSAWPEFIRGFIFIAAIVIIAAHKRVLTAFGLVAVLLVVMAGGAELVRTGEGTAYFQANYLAIAEHVSNPLLVGGFVALLLHLAISKLIRSGTNNVESA